MNCLVLAAVVVIGAYLKQSVAVANVSERVAVGSKHGTQWHRVGPLDAAVVVTLGNVEGKEGGWEGNEARHVVNVELELDIQGVAQCKVIAINLWQWREVHTISGGSECVVVCWVCCN